jgi:hypothetical protein
VLIQGGKKIAGEFLAAIPACDRKKLWLCVSFTVLLEIIFEDMVGGQLEMLQ